MWPKIITVRGIAVQVESMDELEEFVSRFGSDVATTFSAHDSLDSKYEKKLKLENHKAAVALWFAYYNFCRIHGTLGRTPGMEAGITDRQWTLSELAA